MASDPVEDLCEKALAQADRLVTTPDVGDVLRELVVVVRAQRAAARGVWEEAKDAYTKDINLAHPLVTNRFDLYTKAMALVSARRDKYSLIDCMNWLLAVNERLTLIVRKAHAVRKFGRAQDKVELDAMLAEWEQGYDV